MSVTDGGQRERSTSSIVLVCLGLYVLAVGLYLGLLLLEHLV